MKSNVTQLIDRLEAEGLVTRSQDPSDRRSRLAVLTPRGRRACEAGTEIRHRAERELFGVLTGDESLELRRLLAKLTS